MAQNKRACSLLCNKCIAYWFPSVDEDYKDHEHPREPACYRWTRFFSLCLVYLAIMYFIAVFILGFLDKPFIQMSRSQVKSIPAPVVFIYFNSTVYSNYNINCSYVLITGATISCNDKLSNFTDSDSSVIAFIYDDPDTNFTDGTSMNMPIGFEFRISANSSFANDLSPAFLTYPIIQLADPYLFFSKDRHAGNKLIDVMEEQSNTYVLSPYQRQIVWLDRVEYSDLGGSLKRGALSIAVHSSKHIFHYFKLSTKMQSFNPLNPQVVPSQFTTTFEIYNQSSTLITYKESVKASQFKVLTFFTALGGANAFFVTLYMFLYGKKAPGMLPYLIYPFLCCAGPARFVHDRLIATKKTNDLEKNFNS